MFDVAITRLAHSHMWQNHIEAQFLVSKILNQESIICHNSTVLLIYTTAENKQIHSPLFNASVVTE